MEVLYLIIYLLIIGLILAGFFTYSNMRKEDGRFGLFTVVRILGSLISPLPSTVAWKGTEDIKYLLIDHTVTETEPDEEIITYALVSKVTIQDMGQGLHGTLSATSQKLIFAYRDKLNKAAVRIIGFPYQVISDLEIRGRSLTTKIRFLAGGKMVGLRLAVDDLDEMAGIIEEGMSGNTPKIQIDL